MLRRVVDKINNRIQTKGAKELTHIEMASDIRLEAIYYSSVIVEVGADIGGCNISSLSGEGDTGPLNKLVFPTVIPVVL